MVKTGLDNLQKIPRRLRNARMGLVVNPSSVNSGLKHAVEIFFKRFDLRALFGPQHGIRGETQDNMIEWKGFTDPSTGLPVYSLYSETRKPLPEMLRDIDVLVFDIQDIGARYYTFIWTMDLCMEACMENNKAFIILDRPNPISGNKIEGPVLKEDFKSFVGQKPLPVRHGMTIGEIAFYLKERYYQRLELYIVKLTGWKREMWFDDTGLPWVMPSPNMPTIDTASVYPGMCLLEGTNISEGRGTTRPFEIFGAPFIDPDKLIKRLKDMKIESVIFRPLYFQPTFHKYAGQILGGAQIHVINRERFKPFRTGVAIIKAIHDLYEKEFRWKEPPYEYELKKLPIDILAGTDRLRKDIENGKMLDEMEEWWNAELKAFEKVRKEFLLYR